LPGPREQIAFSQAGGAPEFFKPFTAALHDVSVREAIDEVADHLGRGYGWTLFGAQNFRMIRFHAKLIPVQEPNSTKASSPT